MSNNQELNKKHIKKPALGRGLGSLLGERAIQNVETSTPAAVPTPVPAFKAKTETALKDGFVEKPVTTASSVASAPAPVVVAAPEPAKIPDNARIWQIDVAKLHPNERQPRKVFSADPLKELSLSIKEKGILQPITARRLPNGEFEIIAGERRWRAAQAAGLHEVPVILKTSLDQESLELALIENIQRENLNPIEEAEAYNHLLTTYAMTQQQLADKLGKDRATVANTLRLLGLSKATRDLLSQGQISMGHAKVLLAIVDHGQQKAMAEKVASKKWSVRELEREVALLLKPKVVSSGNSAMDGDVSQKFMAGLGEELQKSIGTKVSIDYDKGRGKIAIHFYSDDELNGLVEKLRDSWRK